jgi:hypothetical protein
MIKKDLILLLKKWFQVQNNIDIAINTHAAETHGDFLSPILANFQNVPNILKEKKTLVMHNQIILMSYDEYPVFLRSINDGKSDRKYAHVQIKSKITDNKLWKLNNALWK